MGLKISLGAIVLVSIGLSLPSCSGSGVSSSRSLSTLLPLNSEADTWAREGDAQEFKGDDLYLHINGGAEIYLEYGFRSVIIQDYQSQGSAGLSLEIFEMSNSESAYGMFSFKTSGRGKVLDLGDGAELESYYLNFWKGPYLVTITGFDEGGRTLEGLVGLAEAVEAKIAVSGQKPRLARTLLAMGFEPGRIRYITGFLGLTSVYAFDTARGLNFEDGARAVYGDGNVLLVLAYDSAPAARDAFAELRDHLNTSARFKGLKSPAPDLAVAVDGRDRPLILTPKGPYILMAIGTEPEKAKGLFELVSKILTEIRSPAP